NAASMSNVVRSQHKVTGFPLARERPEGNAHGTAPFVKAYKLVEGGGREAAGGFAKRATRCPLEGLTASYGILRQATLKSSGLQRLVLHFENGELFHAARRAQHGVVALARLRQPP